MRLFIALQNGLLGGNTTFAGPASLEIFYLTKDVLVSLVFLGDTLKQFVLVQQVKLFL